MINDLGHALINFCNVIPAGIVVFFASYSYLDTILESWRKSGILDKIDLKKKVFYESSDSSTDKILEEYTLAIQDPRDKNTGAILLAVVGGKLSEGINFSDDLARAVIMVGMPFANIKSQELIEKMKWMDSRAKETSGLTTGSEYYENICMKSVNQCIGRAIRHIKDYSCIILLDERFARDKIQKKLPKWILDCNLKNVAQFGQAIGQVSLFFKNIKQKKW
jgi:chromosome transmission fidelity protein 1